jgi:hexosaminidase
MAVVKLNVLHLHLSEDQGFRVESKTHPELQLQGSDGDYFTQDQLREIIAYAADRGIRVVPEFDIPGHATSWVVSHPELASAPGPYVIERHWGVRDPVLDPTNEKVYALLQDVLGEMAALFPDPYFHIGGDENNGKQWSANAGIQKFIRDHDLKNNEGLHAYFNRRVRDILTRHGKKMVGWDEILHPDLPKDAIIHSWRGPEGLRDAATRGYATILSNGYYIDLSLHADVHYANDPLPADSKLSPEEQKRILGGEATMWGEWVSPETIDSRIWPRTAAIAERLWSPRTVNNVSDMYRRLPAISQRLEEAGLNHERNRPAMIRRLAGNDASDAELQALTTLVDVIEPVKQYHRGQQQPAFTQHTPLNTLADCARPESEVARKFGENERVFLAIAAKGNSADASERKQQSEAFAAMKSQLHEWQEAGTAAALFFSRRPSDGGGRVVAQTLAGISEAASRALETLHSPGSRVDGAWRAAQLAALDRAAQSHDAIELPIVDPVRRLVTAAP